MKQLFKKKSFTIFLLILLFSLLSNIIQVSAQFDYYEINLPNDPRFGAPQLTSIQLVNGRYIYVHARDDTQEVHGVYVYIFSSSGALLSSFTEDTTDDHDLTTQSLTITDINDNEFLIGFINGADLTSVNGKTQTGVIRVNSITFATSLYNESTWLTGGGGNHEDPSYQIGQFTKYQDCIYGLASASFNGGREYAWVMEFNYTANTFDTNTTLTANFEGWNYLFSNETETTDNMRYIISGKDGDSTRPRFLKWDLDNWETFPETLSDVGSDGIWFEDNILSLRFISAGVVWNVSQSRYLMWFSWAKSETTHSGVHIFQHRLMFNSSGIDIDYLEDQETLTDEVNPNTGFSAQETSVISGYETSKDYFTVFCENKYADPTDFRAYELTIFITNWATFGSASLDVVSNDWYNEIPVPNHQWILYKDSQETLSSGINPARTNVRIYFSLDVEQEGWTISWTYIPADSPLYVNTNYGFSGTTYLNNIGYPSAYLVYFDGVLKYSRSTDSGGDFGFTLLTDIRGIHTLNISVYYNSEYKTSEQEDYLFIESGEAEGTQLGAVMINNILNFLPVFLVVLVPPIALASIMGTLGFMTGLIIGGVIGTMSGVLPTYGLYLIMLVIIMAFVYSMRKGE